MAALDDLKSKFWDDVSWFNAGVFPATNPPYDRFDDDIKMKQIDDPSSWHEGKGPVRTYFQGKGDRDQARFDPDNLPGTLDEPTFIVMPGDTVGFVSGTADFVYSTVGTAAAEHKKRRRIAYSFAYKMAGGVWKANCLWGKYID